MKKLLVVALAAGLVAGSLMGPAQAKKKKPKPKPKPPVTAPSQVDLKFFLRQDSADCGARNDFLSLTDGADTICYSGHGGAIREAYHQANAASEGAVEENAPAAPNGRVRREAVDGLPFVLDGSKHITGEITVKALEINGQRVAAGKAAVDVTLVGEVNGEVKELGTITEEFDATPEMAQTIKIDWTPDAALAGATFTSLELTTELRGVGFGVSGIELDDPASFVIVPALTTTSTAPAPAPAQAPAP